VSDALDAAPDPCRPDVDENGVDLAQIRAMLDLTPAERLTQVARFASALLAVRERNDGRRSG
jgi:hypothetical protein